MPPIFPDGSKYQLDRHLEFDCRYTFAIARPASIFPFRWVRKIKYPSPPNPPKRNEEAPCQNKATAFPAPPIPTSSWCMQYDALAHGHSSRSSAPVEAYSILRSNTGAHFGWGNAKPVPALPLSYSRHPYANALPSMAVSKNQRRKNEPSAPVFQSSPALPKRGQIPW